MTKTLNFNKYLLPLSLPVALIISLILLASSSAFQLNPYWLSTGITLDLVFSIPILYLFLIRKKDIPKTTAFPLFLIGILITGLIIPIEYQQTLNFIKSWIFPIAELGMVSFLIYQTSQIIKKYKREKTANPDFYSALKKACSQILPKRVATIFAMEIAVIYYSLFSWKKVHLNTNEFTYHKKGGLAEITGVFIFLILLETTAVHLFLVNYTPILAWILFFLSLYTALQLFALIKSSSRRFIQMKSDSVFIPHGIFCETIIQFENIEKVELSRRALKPEQMGRNISLLGEMTSHNVLIHLKEKQTLSSLYGIKKEFLVLALNVDQAQKFKETLENNFNNASLDLPI